MARGTCAGVAVPLHSIMISLPPTEPVEHLEKFQALIADIRIAMMTTVAADGSLHTRPMAVQRNPTLDHLWFFTSADSAKAEEIGSTHEVSLGFSDPKHERYVAISGTALIVRDETKAWELWNPWVEVWFPNGPADPVLRLVQVTPHRAEYWDGSSSRMIMLYHAAKVALGGRPTMPGADHAQIDLTR